MRGLFLAIVILFLFVFIFLAGIGSGLLLSGEHSFSSGDKVAVLRVEDVIIDSQIYLDSIETITKDDKVKALVVRIDSPGGAVGPSQEIYSELKELGKKMPIIASIGGVGASGGYYIACSAEKIYANPGAITGSIGVIAQFASYEKLLNWAKIDVEVIKSGKYKDVGSAFREMSEADKQYIQQLIDNVYAQFKTVVATSRGLDTKQIDSVADGKIYTGEQALNLKLIDELGTINDAIAAAGNLGGIEGDPEVITFPKKKSKLFDLLNSKIDTNILTSVPIKSRFGLFYLVDIIN
ncbi:MAG: signal peptide peptidase SppA [Thermodesulfobacteriales bacterium]|nr:MAG: signal peptide peptidase SppA [Thermodesulfobacteriales bacterium]